jgi:stearoyl-CoA desaturase (Delta-9 desaturase)
VTNFAAIVIPFAAFVLAVVLLWGRLVEWIDLAVLAVGYALTCLGVTVGFHRLRTHRSFETYPAVRYALAARHAGGRRVGDQVGGRSPQASRLRRRAR